MANSFNLIWDKYGPSFSEIENTRFQFGVPVTIVGSENDIDKYVEELTLECKGKQFFLKKGDIITNQINQSVKEGEIIYEFPIDRFLIVMSGKGQPTEVYADNLESNSRLFINNFEVINYEGNLTEITKVQ